MCTAMEKRDKKMKILGAIEFLRSEGYADDEIVIKVIRAFNMDTDYVISLLGTKERDF